jgi:protein TonB
MHIAMKQLIPAILILLFLTCCRKFHLDKPTPSVEETSSEICADAIFCVLPAPAEFPGGTMSWRTFLQQNLTYPSSAADAEIQGTVNVQFIVETDGSISDIRAVSGPNELKEAAVEVIRRSPRWIPAQLNGRHFKDYRKQPIIFRLEEE